MRCRVTLKRLRRKGVSTFKASHYNLEWWPRDGGIEMLSMLKNVFAVEL